MKLKYDEIHEIEALRVSEVVVTARHCGSWVYILHDMSGQAHRGDENLADWQRFRSRLTLNTYVPIWPWSLI